MTDPSRTFDVSEMFRCRAAMIVEGKHEDLERFLETMQNAAKLSYGIRVVYMRASNNTLRIVEEPRLSAAEEKCQAKI
jgi:hypothetical protein